ncbi:MAG: biotin--[acetyl-CoA-carboxylase] ligase [Acidobacteriota bacterium]
MAFGGAATDLLLPARVHKALGNARIGGMIHYRASIGSTNDLARRLGQQGESDGCVVVAEEQTCGRGRRHRHWVSPAGRGLYLSVLLRPPTSAAAAGPASQLAAGIAVAEALAGFVPQTPTLRWPNDCYCGNRKLAGVLVEAEVTGLGLDFLVCGIGVNVNHVAEDFPGDIRNRVTSLRMLNGHRTDRFPVLVELLRSLQRWDDVWRRHGIGPIRERWLELSPATRGGEVEVRTDTELLRGVAAGLSASGQLRVQVSGRVREITVGEVVRLNRPAGIA